MYQEAGRYALTNMRLVKTSLAALAVLTLPLTLTGCFGLYVPRSNGEQSIPDGYQDAGTGVAARWAAADESLPCEGSLTLCGTLMVYAYEMCDVYVRVNVVDRDDTVVGFANALGGNLQPGDYGKILLRTYDDGAVNMRLTDLECY